MVARWLMSVRGFLRACGGGARQPRATRRAVLLDDVSFRVGEGVNAAFVGPNGAGKTTLLRLVAGDIQPQAGTVAAAAGSA